MSAYGWANRSSRAEKWKAMNKVQKNGDLWKTVQVATVLGIVVYLISHLLYFWWSL